MATPMVTLTFKMNGDSTSLRVPFDELPKILEDLQNLGIDLSEGKLERRRPSYIEAYQHDGITFYRVYPKQPLTDEGKISNSEKNEILNLLNFGGHVPLWYNFGTARSRTEPPEKWYTVTLASHGNQVVLDAISQINKWERHPDGDIEG